MITRKNETKILAKHISYKCECKLDSRKCHSNQKRNNDKCQCECKNLRKHHACEIFYIWNPSTCTCENSKYL